MISLIITSVNEENTLLRAIKAGLNNLKDIKEKWKIFIVSPDKKAKLLVEKISNSRIQYIKDKGEGKPAALNQVFKQTQADFLILTDGDVCIGNKSIFHILQLLKKDNVGAVTGQPVSTLSKKNMFGYWSWFLTYAAHQMRLKSKQFPCSGYLYGIKNVIKKIPKDSLADDGVITTKLRKKGFTIKYQPKAKVYVKFPQNFKDWLKQKVRSTGGYVQKGISENRNFVQEIKQGLKLFFIYPKNIKEYFWTLLLYLARIYLWILIFWNIKIKNKTFKEIWQRIDSTK